MNGEIPAIRYVGARWVSAGPQPTLQRLLNRDELISFWRAAGVPARMVLVYTPNIQPPDFHAVVEVWLDGSWHLVDPSRLADVSQMVRICTGRDASNISFMTIFGAVQLNRQTVSVTLAQAKARAVSGALKQPSGAA
ncbi:transglutaminase-like domain-containing protein [Henriciella pelagia]|uniref:Transglutaminase-like domain-containing protein n=1 Tax=Henriciella pelagia TaxID=1977912 RepID=A0ABQ1JFT8_9PROT|nr:transglutaminase domain-containing protein [Henriciella pelagia]GGB65234.1 hypothetical protein GCM10011503_12590 [Henriciella pelagia]